MDDRAKQGVAFVCIALICAVLARGIGDAPAGDVLTALAYFIGLAGLAFVAYGLLRPRA